MKTYSLPLSGAALLLTVMQAPLSQATTIVDPGWNLFQTSSGATTIFGESFEGVPLETFDFGGSIGVHNVGLADTINRRLSAASVPGPGNAATVATVIDAFQLRSAGPVSLLGGPLGVYYVTLASRRGGPVSTGTMTINFGPEGDPHGTFSSSLNLFVDVRLGALDGPILDSRQIILPDSGAVMWRHEPTGPVQIPGVNLHLNGVDSANDFWIEGNVSKTLPNGVIVAGNAQFVQVSEWGCTLALLVLSLAALGGIKWADGNASLHRRFV